ncbi:hypothetical protein FIM08_02265 [SAR202 cluster bacterium AC-647-N09_OGT_505m]|nr:hypothetical protein [SAR202 cluster bacterium AC-647-N09_OGT_505m]
MLRKILITGAIGNIECLLISRLSVLTDLGFQALMRDDGKANRPNEAGVDCVPETVADSEAGIQAVAGIYAVVLITAQAPNPNEQASGCSPLLQLLELARPGWYLSSRPPRMSRPTMPGYTAELIIASNHQASTM